ncbi:SGNH/GDSL hydrolase family protein [Bacillus songklensis]|uniref:SGNH/GDSL hydrolase family protein n=1 Tax=Bacillus songklensis TaxID=1069116 RepID=A0ABV8B658_9BACI
MRGKWVPFIAVISGLSCLLWIVGLGWSLYDYFNEPKKSPAIETPDIESAEEGKDRFDIVALGDSLTRGTGDPTGKGYVGDLVENLKKKSDRKMLLSNFGIKGQTSAQLANQVKQKELQRQIKKADIILITIGGNDLFRGGQTLENLNIQDVKKLEENYLQNLKGILSNLRSANSEATIFLIGLYNPFIELDDAKLTSKIVRDWNYESAEVSAKYPKTVFVPTFDLFQLKADDYLYTDKFHPNAKGYQLIAERVASLITW